MSAVQLYDADQLAGLLGMLPDVDSVELKLSIPDAERPQVFRSLDLDPLLAQVRQVAFLDTPDLKLSEAGVVIRVRRTQGRPGDLTVKLRPMLPSDVPAEMRGVSGFKVEVDASPTGYTCSCSLTTEISDRKAKALMGQQESLKKLLSRRQRAMVEDRLPPGVSFADIRVLGPLTLLKAKFAPADFNRKMTLELWFMPDGGRLLELSTKTDPVAAFQAAAETKVFLARRDIDLGAPQETKTRRALAVLAAQYDAAQP